MGKGLIGYSKRFGTAYADAIIGNFGTGAIFPTLLRQDPRYYQMGKGNFFYRFEYAAAAGFDHPLGRFRESISSTFPNSLAMAWPPVSPTRTILAPILWQATPTFWARKFC